MSDASVPAPAPPAKSVERLFPFVLRSRGLMVGRDTLWRGRPRLQFVLITGDLSENSRAEILRDFAPYPIVQHYTAADLDKHFGVKGAKVVGFVKSTLASSIYRELKEYRLNKPANPNAPAAEPASEGLCTHRKEGDGTSDGTPEAH